MFIFRRAIIKFITPLAWRFSNERQCRALLEFSIVEKDSASQLIDAMKFVDDPGARSEIFQHVLEEYHHADLFEDACEKLSTSRLISPVLTRDRLVGPEKSDFDRLDFLTYVYVGEKNVNRDFSTYAKVSRDELVANVFKKVQADEAGHEAHTFNMLSQLASRHKSVLHWRLLKAGWKLRYRSYVGSMRGFGEAFLTFWLAVIYFALGWVIAPACRGRLALDESKQFEIFSRAEDHLKL